MSSPVRVLFLADSHLGTDLPTSPRITRRRRGHDFLANHAAALAPALRGEVDLVVHGGDVFDRPRVPASLAHQAYAPLLRVAEQGVPVFIVPGNHERGRLPHARFLTHPLVHVFDVPRSYAVRVRDTRVVLAGFPYERRHVRARFPELLERTGWRAPPADVRLLCIHHCVEGATVGPGEFTFTTAPDVVRGRDIPAGLAGVLSGHIHRHQVLTAHLSGRRLGAPVLYPGSIERTSSAEIGESKGYLILDVTPGESAPALRWEFRELPARPMLLRSIPAGDPAGLELERSLRALVAAAPADAVLRVSVEGAVTPAQLRVISSRHLRTLAPDTMNLECRARIMRPAYSRGSARARPARAPDPNLCLGL